MNRIKSTQELKEILHEYVINSNKSSVKILAGHLPMLYDEKEVRAISLGVDRWGVFSKYTFQLGAEVFIDATNVGKKSGLLVLVDDLVEINLIEKNKKVIRDDKKWMKNQRRKFYSGAHLPIEYLEILNSYDLPEDIVEEQRRSNGSYSKLISEKMTKASAISKGLIAPTECAQSYKGLIYDTRFFDMNSDFLISFIPGQCKGNICSGVIDVVSNLDSLHIMFPHMEDLGGLMARGDGTYIKGSRKPMTIDEIYEAGVYYIRKEASITKNK
ncbi:MAG: hypothetical protein WC758_03290 [Candidatus Woesearchaeota archaeon]|jgi:hypothetical protein